MSGAAVATVAAAAKAAYAVSALTNLVIVLSPLVLTKKCASPSGQARYRPRRSALRDGSRLALGAAVAAVALAGRVLPRRSGNAQSQLLTFSLRRWTDHRHAHCKRASVVTGSYRLAVPVIAGSLSTATVAFTLRFHVNRQPQFVRQMVPGAARSPTKGRLRYSMRRDSRDRFHSRSVGNEPLRSTVSRRIMRLCVSDAPSARSDSIRATSAGSSATATCSV